MERLLFEFDDWTVTATELHACLKERVPIRDHRDRVTRIRRGPHSPSH